ncbi:glycosyltransferase family 4 protein [Candidatus Giovannonibacteria bacterium]|nr:glycosyltransferase family 4 protein [Candidatus Giovannonibacteria bacterium]
MRILIATPLFPPDIGGPATYSKLLSVELPKRGVDAEILSFGEVRHLPKVLRHLAYFWKLVRKCRHADIIFAQDPVSVGFPATLAARLLRKRFYLKIVGDYAWEQGVQRFGVKETLDDFLKKSYGLKVEFFRILQKFSADSVFKIIVPSVYLKKTVALWGVPDDKIHVIYNAFEAPQFTVAKDEARKRLGISGTIIVSAGRDVPWKGFKTLREIMPDILKQIPDAKLFILTGEPREKLLLYLRAADVFVLNTAYEGLSHQLLEAMAAGTPIITTDVGGNPEVIENGKDGLLVPYNDREKLKEAVVTMMMDSVMRDKFVQNSCEKLKKFEKEQMITETIKILKQ